MRIWSSGGPGYRRLLLFSPFLLIGAGMAVWFVVNATGPERTEPGEQARAVRVISAPLVEVRPRATGFGIARPANTWRAATNVGGTVVYRHPDLESGSLVEKGTRLLQIDPTEYELAIAEARAEIAALEAEARLLEGEEVNLERILLIEEERLSLAERELQRTEDLARTDAISSAQLDEQLRATLLQRMALQELENQLALFPNRKLRVAAEQERARSRLARAEKNLADTVLFAPFDLRVAEVHVEQYQFVPAGRELFVADDVALAEVPAQVPLETFRRLVGSVMEANRPEGFGPMQQGAFDAIEARVELLESGGGTWPARVSRVENGVDPRTRTARVVLEVEEPYRRAHPPDRPPLVKNMYVRTFLLGQPIGATVLVPEMAVHDGIVYTLDAENRLTFSQVEVAFVQDGFAAITGGLDGGELVVLDDLIPAIEGMLTSPTRDHAAEEWLVRTAREEGP